MPDHSLASRRRFLASTLAASGGAWLQGCAEFRDIPVRMPAEPAAGMPFIDAHCHIFNARDIPVYEFACHVVADIDERPERGLIRGIVERVSDVLVSSAPTVYAEEQQLAKILADKDADPQRFDLARYEDGPLTGEEVIARCLGAIFGGVIPKKAPFCRNPILAETISDEGVRAALERRTTLPIAWAPGPLLRRIARELLARPGAVGNAMRWLVLLTRYRYAIAGRLFGLYGQRESGVNVAAPAMVDFDLWLGEGRDLPETEALARQIGVMEQLVRLFDGRLTPLVPFDPWRQALWTLRAARGRTDSHPSPLRIVEDAIENRGFVGVKLYPPMGFQPHANADFRPRPGDDPARFPLGYAADFGDAQTFARALDRALAELYALCESKTIPITTHTRDSQVVVHPLGSRANPRHWEPIIRAHRRMRVNLAHIGNMYEMAGDVPRQAFEKGWADNAFDLMERYDNAFGDVGYFTYLAARGDLSPAAAGLRAKTDTFFRNLGLALEQHRRAARRLMYGSDWNILGHVNGHETYQQSFATAMREQHPALFERFMGGAAAEFLGLYEYDRHSRPSPTFQRLRRFYARQKMSGAAAFQQRFFARRGPEGRVSTT